MSTDIKKKRRVYTEEEKLILAMSVSKRREVIESKKSDAVSVVRKSACWEEVAEEFNSHPTSTKSTTGQLRKLWENIKFRRKAEFGQDKGERMQIGGSSFTPGILDESESNNIGVDIKLENDVDSDTFVLDANMFRIVPIADDNPHTILSTSSQSSPNPNRYHQTPMDPIHIASSSAEASFTSQKRRREADINEQSENEESLSRRRNLQFMKQDQDLHEIKIKEQLLLVRLMENQILSSQNEEDAKKRRNEQEAELHKLAVVNIQLDIQAKKKLQQLDIKLKENQILHEQELFELRKKELTAKLLTE